MELVLLLLSLLHFDYPLAVFVVDKRTKQPNALETIREHHRKHIHPNGKENKKKSIQPTYRMTGGARQEIIVVTLCTTSKVKWQQYAVKKKQQRQQQPQMRRTEQMVKCRSFNTQQKGNIFHRISSADGIQSVRYLVYLSFFQISQTRITENTFVSLKDRLQVNSGYFLRIPTDIPFRTSINFVSL